MPILTPKSNPETKWIAFVQLLIRLGNFVKQNERVARLGYGSGEDRRRICGVIIVSITGVDTDAAASCLPCAPQISSRLTQRQLNRYLIAGELH